MKYVYYNIRNLVKNERFMFALIFLCIFVSAWIMTFAYGLYWHYYSMRVNVDSENKQITPSITEGEALTCGEFKVYLDSLPNRLTNDMSYIYCDAYYTFEDAAHPGSDLEDIIVSRFVISDGEYRLSSFIFELWNEKNFIASGRFLLDSEETDGSPSALIEEHIISDELSREAYKNIMTDDTMLIYGKKYNIVGSHTTHSGNVVPFLSIPEEIPLRRMSFCFDNIVTRKSYNELVGIADEVIPGKLVFPEFEAPDEESVSIYNNIMIISVLIAALVIINFAFLYRFIFAKRRRQLAIMRICGCTSARAWAICLGECFAFCAPIFLFGMFTYIPFMHGVLSDVFVYMEDAYKPWIYAAIFGIYIAALFVIMGIFLAGQIRKSLSEGRKETAV